MPTTLPLLPPPTLRWTAPTRWRIQARQEGQATDSEGDSTQLMITLSLENDDQNEKNKIENQKWLGLSAWHPLWFFFASFKNSSKPNPDLIIKFGEGFSDDQRRHVLREWSLLSDESLSESIKVSKSWCYKHYPNIFSNFKSSENYLIESKDEKLNLEKTQDLLIDSDLDLNLKSLIIRPKQEDLPLPPNTIYERYITHLETYFCLSIYGNTEEDIELLHNWLNDPRVDEFWRDSGTKESHIEWLRERYLDPHVLPILGSFRFREPNGNLILTPFAYYEIYWASEDKISKYYKSDKWDRGIHMLVGSSENRGPHRVKSWLPSLVHYIFSDDDRTRKVVSEPDHRNTKMIRYLESVGFEKIDQVNMGHKIASIMILTRENFWDQCPL